MQDSQAPPARVEAGPRRWLQALRRLHVVERRGRWAYRLETGIRHAPQALAESLLLLPGVIQARENSVLRTVAVVFDHTTTNLEQLEQQMLDLVAPWPEPERPPTSADQGGWTLLGLALLNLAGSRLLPRSSRIAVSSALAWPIWSQASAELSQGRLGSHGLEAAAVLVSLRQNDIQAANITTLLLLLGDRLERSIRQRSDALLLSLLRPSQEDVWVERDGVELRIPQAELRPGETVVLTTGAIVPVDGTVLGGRATLNEAVMTGESRPTAKSRGDRVLSGTVVEEGRLLLYAERVGRDTAAAKIASTVRDALASRSSLQISASQLADRLVPAVFALAGLSWLGSRSWTRAAAVLQADYCCALKLSIPVAFKAAMARAGNHGLLVKGASALEQLAEADTFVFDKTGTLTTGRLVVSDALSFDSTYTPESILNLAASIEEHAVHPVALAVVEAAHKQRYQHFDHADVEFVVAHGVVSSLAGKRVVVGSEHFVIDDEGVTAGPYRSRIEPLLAAGKSLLYIGFDGRLIGVVALEDQLRPNSNAMVQRLRQLGVKRVLMFSGDREELARQVAEACGLDGVQAQLLPSDKARLVQQLRDQGAKVVFVGDGINDAPALVGASVGIAMQRGADLARLSADVTLLEDNIMRVAEVKALANASMQRIQRNTQATLAVNSLILAGAALGWLSTVQSSLLHNGSTVGILLSALAAGGSTVFEPPQSELHHWRF